MTPELDPQMEAATRRRLTQLYDAIDVGPPPTRSDLELLDVGTLRSAEGPRRAPTSKRPLFTIMAAAAALIVVAVIVRQLAADKPPVAETDEGDPTHLVPDRLPEGLQSNGTFGLPMSGEDTGPGRTTATVYGDPAAADPFATVDLAVFVVHDETIGLGDEEVTVRGHDGYAGDDLSYDSVGIAGGPGDARWISWDENADAEITLVSRTLSAPVLAEMAELLEFDGERVTLGSLPAGAPGELEQLGTLDDVTFGGASYVSDSARGFYDHYSPPLDQYDEAMASEEATANWQTLSVSCAENIGGDDLVVVRWMTDAEEVDVRGKPGWIVESTDEPYVLVFWQESAAELNIVTGGYLSTDEVLRFTAGLRPG